MIRLDHSGKSSAIDIVLQLHEQDFYRRCQGKHQGVFFILTISGENIISRFVRWKKFRWELYQR